MTHIFTLLNHGEHNYNTGGHADPSDPRNKTWDAFIARLKDAAPTEAEDPFDDRPDYPRAYLWSCACGAVQVG